MEFEQLQKIWIEERQENFFAINEVAMLNNIRIRKNKVKHIADVSELLTIVVNLAAGIFIAVINYSNKSQALLYVLGAWMLGTAVFALLHRLSRMSVQSSFDRSVNEDLREGISAATYQVRLSQLMRFNIIPVAVIVSLAIWNSGKSIWFVIGTLVSMGLVYYFGGWEHNIYKRKLKELVELKEKLEG